MIRFAPSPFSTRVLALGLLALTLVGPGVAHALCSTTICTGTSTACSISGVHSIDSLCTLDFGTKHVTILKNARLEGGPYTILAGSLVVQGELQSIGGGVTAQVAGDFETVVVSNSAGRVDCREGGSIDITAGGGVTIGGKAFDTSGTGGNDGGTIDVTAGGCITVNKPVDANGGGTLAWGGDITFDGSCITVDASITAIGSGGGDGGAVSLTAGGAIHVHNNIDASGGGDFAFGGDITLDGGSIATTALLKTVGTQDGDGGLVTLSAAGAVTLDGGINASASGDIAFGGDIDVDGATVSTSSVWNTSGGIGGSGGDITVFADTTLTTTSTASFDCTAGGGGDGCFVTLGAGSDVGLDGDINAGASGTDAFAGDIDVTSLNGDIHLGTTAVLTADVGTAGFSNGTITLGPACGVSVEGTLDSRTNAVGGGGNTVIYRDSFDGSQATLRADDDTGNDLRCRCIDDSPADGVCDPPARCVSAPFTAGGTYVPDPVTVPIPLSPCL